MTADHFLSQTPRRLHEDRGMFFLLAALLLVLYLPGLGSYGLYDPWETHYGEVARNMVEHDNYIDPWWGSPWDSQGVKREREGFYSKPPLIMWMMAAGMNLLGYNEWGVRLFFPLLSILGLLAIYLAVSRFHNRRAGLIATLVCATCPFFAILSRQAVTDGPMVAIMTAGIMFLALGLFAVDDEERVGKGLYWLTLVTLLFVVLGQLWAILALDRSPDIVRATGPRPLLFTIQAFAREIITVGRGKGWVISTLLLPVGLLAVWRVARERRRRLFYVYLFYICCGLTVPAKGWLAWMPAGGTIVGYMLITWDWKILKRVDPLGGLLLVFMTGHPWIVAMLGGHHPGWYNRFWIHDHWNRLFHGVHKTDDGGFEYFIKWLGYGLFPWVGLLPGAIVRVLGLRASGDTSLPAAERYTPRQKFEIFIILWGLIAYVALSSSSTKFHHYILPAVPPLAILIGLFIEDVLAGRGRGRNVLIAAALVITVWVGQDLYRMPKNYGDASQNIVNLFTYKYDREWPEFTDDKALAELGGEAREKAEAENEWLQDFAASLQWIAIVASLGYLLMLLRGWIREYGVAVTGVAGLWAAIWVLHTFLPKVAVHWSQKGMWDAYYQDCQLYTPDELPEFETHMLQTASRASQKPEMFPKAWCREPVVAFRTNWRGETFYSSNTVVPAIETEHLGKFLTEYSDQKPFYLFTERSRVKSELEPNLPKHLKGQYREIYQANNKFVLLRIEPPEAEEG